MVWQTVLRLVRLGLLGFGLLLAPSGGSARAETVFESIPTQFIAALADPGANAGTGAENWGLWHLDPGPRGVRLSSFGQLAEAGGEAPAGWRSDSANWWLEENGLIMEAPAFPMTPGRYMVTGNREVTTVLTVHAKDTDGQQRWELADGATIHDVTHLRCRSARYTPAASANTCTPANVIRNEFPVAPGGLMPAVEGCTKQDYSVLFVVAVARQD